MTEWDAAEYARRSGLQAQNAAEALGLLELEGSERVLDVGCGDGRVTAEVAGRVPRGSVVGVDPSREMIAFASSRSGPNLRFEVADARSLPFRGEFDLVVTFNALHWVPEQERALRSIRSALKPDGRALIRLVPQGSRESLEDVIEETRSSPRWAGYFREFRRPYLHMTPEEYGALAERSGLRVLSIRSEAKAWDFETRAGFLAFGAVTFVEWTKFLPEAERTAFINDVLDRYAPVAADRPGEENTFKFYQMDVTLEPDRLGGETSPDPSADAVV
jgi:trans-aconitate 2-methyltransferase